ncbi:hypothetical protein Ahy_B01g054190 isoform A [Arachis hypogaea]|uniref:DUF7950 domain-containing protein n=1 Tax=Arachis hypogaea TaxID=3818 RepID=A0A445ATI5_ARAHY|nr:hypothetical protein Ahy_B01g054190 isoform A [Arachis hypogaea]
MDGRGGCCIARYAPGAYDMSKVDRPVAGASATGVTASDGSSSESSDAFSKSCGRTKRKYVRDNNTGKNNNNNENNRPAPVITLPLLPETPDPKESHNNNHSNTNSNGNNGLSKNVPVWLSFENSGGGSDPYWYGGASSYSCVTVECVTDTWREGEGLQVLGGTDEERKVNLGDDTCPGFISDGYGRVTWTNGAYREMVGQKNEGAVVVLAMKVGAVVPYPCSFTCRVRVVQFHAGKERSALTVPCDVWRMDFGGFAWRLDVKAALSLRLGS